MGKLGTLSARSQSWWDVPISSGFGYQGQCQSDDIWVHEHSQSKKFLEGDMLPGFELCPELSCVLLWPSPQDRSWTASCLITFTARGSVWHCTRCLLFQIAVRHGPGNETAQRSQLSHVTKTRPSCQTGLYVGLQFRPGLGHCWRSRHCPVVFFVFLRMTPACPLWATHWPHAQNGPQQRRSEVKQTELKSCLSGHVTLGQCRPLQVSVSVLVSLITVLVFVFLKFLMR